MHAPPPFECTCSDGPLWRAAQAALWALAAAGLAAWAQGPVWVLLAAVVAGAALGWRLSRPVPVRLAWDGARWRVGFGAQAAGSSGPAGSCAHGAPGAVATVQATLDLGGWMLLKLRPAGGPVRWLGVSRTAAAGPAWHLLRAAVYCAPPDLTARTDEGRAAP